MKVVIWKFAGSRYRLVLLVIGFCLLAGLTVRFSEQVSSQQKGPANHQTNQVYSSWPTKGTEQMIVPDIYRAGYSLSQLKGSGRQVCQTEGFKNPFPINQMPTLDEESTLTVPDANTGTLEKMIPASGWATMDIDLNKLNGIDSPMRNSALRFETDRDSFFTILIFNGEFRAALPSTLGLTPQNSVPLPGTLNASYRQLVVESLPWGAPYEMDVRNGNTGFVFFNIEGQQYRYERQTKLLSVQHGQALVVKRVCRRTRPSLRCRFCGRKDIDHGDDARY